MEGNNIYNLLTQTFWEFIFCIKKIEFTQIFHLLTITGRFPVVDGVKTFKYKQSSSEFGIGIPAIGRCGHEGP